MLTVGVLFTEQKTSYGYLGFVGLKLKLLKLDNDYD